MKCTSCGGEPRPKGGKKKITPQADTRRMVCKECGDEWDAVETEVPGTRQRALAKGEAALAAKAAAVEKTRATIAAFCETWKQVRGPTPYRVAAKDAGQVTAMLKLSPDLTVEELRPAFRRYLADRDPFLERQGHTLAWFCSSGLVNRYGSGNAPPARANGVGHYPTAAAEDYGPSGEREI